MSKFHSATLGRVIVGLAVGLSAAGAGAAAARTRSARVENAARLAMLTDAARAGEAEAQFELAERYAQGDGVGQDMREAVLWWIQATRQGHPAAAARLADAIEEGQHLPGDPVRAQAFRRRAAEWGSAEAQWRLSRDVEDPAEAMDWLRRAAEGGQADAAHALARHYEEGEQVEADPGRAVELYRKAAAAGHASAANTLGVLLAEGAAGTPDLTGAYFWFNVAAEHGISASKRNRDAVAEQLPRRDQRRIRRQAEQFLAGAADPPDA